MQKSHAFSRRTFSLDYPFQHLRQLEFFGDLRHGPAMFRLLIRTVVWLVRAALRSRDDLVLENLALRQQLAIYKEKRPRLQLTDSARAFWVGLRAVWPGWRNALILVQPDTVVRWHRQGFVWFWRRNCRSSPRGRPPVTRELRDLIRRMATENRWCAPRIHAELLKLLPPSRSAPSLATCRGAPRALTP